MCFYGSKDQFQRYVNTYGVEREVSQMRAVGASDHFPVTVRFRGSCDRLTWNKPMKPLGTIQAEGREGQ